MTVKYVYELTKQTGETLYESLRTSDYERLRDIETKRYFEQSAVGHALRTLFVGWLSTDLSSQEVKPLELAAGDTILKEWLLENEVPDQEVALRGRYSKAIVSQLLSCHSRGQGLPLLLNHIDKNNDAKVALAFHLISYPPIAEDGKYADTGDVRQISAEAANRIQDLIDSAKRKKEEKRQHNGNHKAAHERDREIEQEKRELYRSASELEEEAVLKEIRIQAIECDICGPPPAMYPRSLTKSELPVCPNCAHPICPACANMMENDPKTMEEAKAYLASCDENAGMAFCGGCGDWSVIFMLRFLKLKGCPIPPEYSQYKARQRSFRLCTTSTVAALSDVEKIVEPVLRRFYEGISGIIKVQHVTGEIWGIPERHEEGWVVTICYPDER